MKKFFLSICLTMMGSMLLFAQKANVSQAESLTLQEKPDFNGARAAIKPAFLNDQTKDDPRTYFVAGLIGYTENDAFAKQLLLGKQIDQDAKGKALIESYNYFLKAYDLDQKPDEKGKVKPKYAKKIKDYVKEYYTAQYNLFGYGAYLFDKKDYKGAYDVFSIYLQIPKLPMMNNELSTNDSTYKMIEYYTGLAASNLQEHDKAIAIYNDLKTKNYETNNVYQLLSDEYRNIKDTVNYLATLEEGFKLFPKEPWFLQNIINHYIYSNKIEQASKYLDAAIAQTPDVPDYYYVKGNVEERLGNLDGALKAFEKAIELKPDMADAYAGIGRLIFNQGVEILKAADQIKDNKLYNQEVQRANDIFKQSQPYLEKASQLDPKNTDFKQVLKMLYYRIDPEKYDAISKELAN